jgi:predicted dehydrogenase
VITRVAVVGTGVWAEQHTKLFDARGDTELVGVAGRHEERTAERAAKYRTRGFTSIDRMLDETQPDLVTVSLPNEHHFDPTMHLIERGVPLLVEKPLVFELGQADALLEAAGDQFFAINFNHRYAKTVQRGAAAIERGDLGDLYFATWRFGGEPGTSAHPHAQIIETQCHAFDMLEYLVGPIASVAAQMTDKSGAGYTTTAIALEFANGAVGTLLGSYDSSYAYPRTHYLEVNGDAGRLTIEDTVKRLTISRAGKETASVWEAGFFNDEDRDFHATFGGHLDALLPALSAGEPPPIHARAGRRALALALASIESFETGRRIATPA